MMPTPWEQIVAALPDAVVVTSRDGIILFANPAAHELFSNDQSLVGTVAGFSPASDTVEIEVLQNAQSRVAEIRTVLCEWIGRPALLSTLRDVTERKRSSRDIGQAQKMEAIASVAGGIAHDFNNLLLVMLIYAEMIRGECAEDDKRLPDVLEVIHAIDRGQALTRQLLAFSRKSPTQSTALQLGEIIDALLPTLRQTLPANIEITTRSAEKLWPVLADREQVEQLVLNLATNAVDAMPDGGRFELEVQNRTIPSSDPAVRAGEYVVLRAIDSGGVIAPAHLERIFEPFFIARERGRGNGLGLAACYGIVLQCGGTISVQSEPGKGTVFTIALPRVREVAPAIPAGQQTAADPEGAEIILVVEDDVAVMRATVSILKAQGYGVMTAANGEEARSVLHAQGDRIDLVLSDIVMPRLGGLELEKIIAQSWPHLPVILMTGYSEQPVLHQNGGMRIENRPALMKPFRGPALLRIVRDTLDL